MDWSQIKKHPFIVNKVDNFNFIELNKIKVIDKNKIEINFKNDDNLLWILSEEKKGLIEEIKKAEDLKKEAEIKINESKEKNKEKEKMIIKIKELGSKIENNENENIKKEIDEYKNKINEIDEFINNSDKLFTNAENMKKKAEESLVSKQLKEIILEEELSSLKNEKDILNYFSNKEKECTNWIFRKFGVNKSLNEFFQTKLKDLFDNNSYISEITKMIYS